MKFKAFTLAEVLITLAIIGIVAAITIPQLIQNYKKIEYSSKLKKFYSTMQQAIQMSELDNGELEAWEYSVYETDEDGNYLETNYTYIENWMKKYLLPYIKYNKYVAGYNSIDSETGDSNVNLPVVYLSDGSKFYINRGDCMDINYDVNGDKMPDAKGKDLFAFTFCFGVYNQKKGFFPYLEYHITSRDGALQRCKIQPSYCSVLLKYDNWEFKDDYPYKL